MASHPSLAFQMNQISFNRRSDSGRSSPFICLPRIMNQALTFIIFEFSKSRKVNWNGERLSQDTKGLKRKKDRIDNTYSNKRIEYQTNYYCW
jgi:hypothetical protein